MATIIFGIELLATFTALAAAWLWFHASGGRVRRVHTRDLIDGGDINRLVVAMNRAQMLNRRAALAATASALLVALLTAANIIKGR
ncbi:hypothetical protein [Roseomonas marmotae]|uniref:Uncharacterized protein n=1 Tax=Roseomonas marmotae TaxID=2768161 RepID=A0ABS3KI40_9PROT|nr:hypothetical protein [Roseomonas marmotae]MBO1077119.1 hypothetical protein [Roseomonas marmotae]QTI81165.1 hypothetical protein IAI58_17585 [Roseomonas marmotae]